MRPMLRVGRVFTRQRTVAMFSAVVIAVSLVAQFYQAEPVEAGVTTWPGNSEVTAVSAGGFHSCAIAGEAAYCWGDNSMGQLGNNSTDSSLVPVAVDTSGVLAGKTVTDVVASSYTHTCAVASGKAYCWGDNWSGQLGNNSTDSSLVPVAVDTSGVLAGKTVTDISAGSAMCAIADGAAYCWGMNVGNGTSGTNLVPVDVSSVSALAGKEITTISGSTHTCAIADGRVYCWGLNTYGQLGDGSTTERLTPVYVQTSTTPLNASSYRLYENANSATPGNPLANVNSSSQLATSGEAFRLRQGIDNGFKTGMTTITAGDSHTCGVAYRQAYCWGGNGYGQLGNNSTAQSNVPVAVDASGALSGKTVTAISAGNHHTCAIADGAAYCWGDNGYGQLGNNSTAQSNVPVAVSTAGELSGKTVTAIFASHSHTCAIADGAAYCWGRNNFGQLGDNSATTSNVPVAVSTAGELSGKTVTALTGGYFYTCVIADGAAYCWGTNYIGMLGNNSYASSSVPVAVDTSGALSGKNITAISASGEHTCAIADGAAYCWGYNGNGQLGNDDTYDSPVPVAVSTVGVLAGKTITTISAGDYHSCAIADGQAYCWGYNSDGQLGDNSTNQRNIPVAVSTAGELSDKTVITITASFSQTCVIADEAAYCWGYNSDGQLGDNSTTQRLVAVAVDATLLGGGGSESPFLGPTILAGANTFVLQFTELSAAGCSLQTTGYSAVTGSTAIAYNTNAGVANGAAITTNANDPTDNAKTTPLTYRSAAGTFTNAVDIPPGNTGLFDFSLKDNGAAANTTYCLRIAYADGSPIENATAYAEITTANGVLLIDIVNGSDVLVPSPSFSMTSTTAKTACQSVSGSFGTSSQRIRIFNSLSSTGWSVNTSATSGPTATWSSGGSSYDFNDPSGSPSGCNSGSDGDGVAGRLTLNPSLSTLTPQAGCSITGLSKGSSAGFSQGVLDAVTLLSASTATSMNCYYYITGVDMLQYIPANQPPGSYSINLTTTVVAQ